MRLFSYIFLGMIPLCVYGIGIGAYWHIVTLIICLLFGVMLHPRQNKRNANVKNRPN